MFQQSQFSFHPNNFSDSENIIIIDNIPYFHYPGTTYKDKIKNRLSLECLFEHENYIPKYIDLNEQPIEEDKDKTFNIKNVDLVDYGEKHDFYEKTEFKIFGTKRKGKRLPLKKKQARNIKKNTFKTNGYTNKLFTIEQNLPELYYEPDNFEYDLLKWYYDYYNNSDDDTDNDTNDDIPSWYYDKDELDDWYQRNL